MIGLFGFLLLFISAVQAVYSDEAFETDWQLQNVGEYRCVFENGDQKYLVALSELGNKTLISFINEFNGNLFYRQQLEFRAVDAMTTEHGAEFVLKDDHGLLRAFNGSTGFPIEKDLSNFSFNSHCKPNMSGFKVMNNSLQIIDPDSSLVVFQVDIWDTFEKVEYIRTDFAGNLKLLYSTVDSEYVFQSIEEGGVKSEWSRDEKTTDVVAHTVIDLPDSSLDAISQELLMEEDTASSWDAYRYRVSKNWQRFKQFLERHNYSPGTMVNNMLKSDDDNSNKKRDLIFGLAKYLVVATEKSRIVALSIKNGTTEWSLQSSLNDIVLLEWFPQSRELVAFGKDGTYELYSLANLSSPALAKTGDLGKKSIKSISLLDGFNFLVTTYDGLSSVVSLSPNDEPTPNTFICTHDETHIHGNLVSSNGQLKETWTIALEESEKLVGFAVREHHPVVTLGQTLGDRTVLYKYLYPNLACYAVFNSASGRLYVNLIDTVTGALFYTQYHDDRTNPDMPMDMVFGEHWFVYSYFSEEPIPEQKLVVVDLFESLQPNTRVSASSTELDPLKGVHRPEVLSKAYFFPEVIKHMRLSETKFGITIKSIVLELENGQITYLTRTLLNARREQEFKMSDDDKKEFMMVPYHSTLPINDHFMITHVRHLIWGPNSKLISIPTNLESTSFVCDLGHDIFCAMISPSGQFDVMSPTFERVKLIGTIVGLIVLCYFVKPSVEAKKLKNSWMVRS
ncbi:EMC1 (YCL045C) [Zygosaccharomyces parabailii]|nr:EMC1 (YCL045C) [Zygosaccharomyces parabailii]